MESARRASAVHRLRTGRGLRITEEGVINEEMYEEEDDDLPVQYRRLTAHLLNVNTDFGRRLNEYITNHQALRQATTTVMPPGYNQMPPTRPSPTAPPSIFMPYMPYGQHTQQIPYGQHPQEAPMQPQFAPPAIYGQTPYSFPQAQQNTFQQQQPSFTPGMPMNSNVQINSPRTADLAFNEHMFMPSFHRGLNSFIANAGATAFYDPDVPLSMPQASSTTMSMPNTFNTTVGTPGTHDSNMSTPLTHETPSSTPRRYDTRSTMTPPTRAAQQEQSQTQVTPERVLTETIIPSIERAEPSMVASPTPSQHSQVNQLPEANQGPEEDVDADAEELVALNWADFMEGEDDWDQQENLA
jgi:hypothetical protein